MRRAFFAVLAWPLGIIPALALQGRRGETETVTASFGPRGTVVRGSRSAFTTGTPARLSEDRNLALLPADTAGARRLADVLRIRCRS